MADYLTELNKIGTCTSKEFKPTIKYEALTLNNKYKVEDIRCIVTKHGPAVVAELLEGSLFLPKRFIKSLTTEIIESLLAEPGCFIVFKGVKRFGSIPTPLFEFEKL